MFIHWFNIQIIIIFKMNNNSGIEEVAFDNVENTGITSAETQGAVVLNRLLNKKTKKIHSATNLSASVTPSKRAASAAGLTRDSTSLSMTHSSVTVTQQETEHSSSSNALEASVLLRSIHDNPVARKNWEFTKFHDAVTFVHHAISQSNRDELIYEKFKFTGCYDVTFLQALAEEFKVDLSGILSKRRATHKEVLNEFISKL
jgi:hypothetical protein